MFGYLRVRSDALIDISAHFDSIATEFEIKERIDAFNKKIDYAQEVQSTLRALLTEVSHLIHNRRQND